MGVRKDNSKNGKWLAEAFVKGKRVRRWFDTKAEASRFFNVLKMDNSPLAQSVLVNRAQPQRLSELAQMWFDLHGNTLISGQDILQKLLWMAEKMGDPLARDFSAEMFAEFRAKRLSGEIVNDTNGIVPKPSVLNREHSMLRAMFNELGRLNKWSGDNPLKTVRKFRVQESEIAFLRDDEIKRLLAVCDSSKFPHLGLIVRVCLATGARWSEAQGLTGAQIIPFKITYTRTKNGKSRTVPISESLYKMLPLKQGHIFEGSNYHTSTKEFVSVLKKAGISLPRGKSTHILRHTFASHFMMNGGNILVLRDILGHSDIKMTMRYAHFAPSYLESAATLNPLANIG